MDYLSSNEDAYVNTPLPSAALRTQVYQPYTTLAAPPEKILESTDQWILQQSPKTHRLTQTQFGNATTPSTTTGARLLSSLGQSGPPQFNRPKNPLGSDGLHCSAGPDASPNNLRQVTLGSSREDKIAKHDGDTGQRKLRTGDSDSRNLKPRLKMTQANHGLKRKTDSLHSSATISEDYSDKAYVTKKLYCAMGHNEHSPSHPNPYSDAPAGNEPCEPRPEPTANIITEPYVVFIARMQGYISVEDMERNLGPEAVVREFMEGPYTIV